MMKTKLFSVLCFCALLMFVVAIEHSKEGKQFGETRKSKTNIIADGYGVWPSGFGIWYKPSGNTNGGGGGNIINFPGSGKRGGGANINRERKSSLEKVCIEH
uniref:Nodule-specific Glycine Rich Peptide n=1 Tax=Medicago truncatula TaxID=3880 RepID=I3T867_MEDTR|nr:unknown [Medicago truncatula]